jgi:hypothetical protein
MPARQIDYQKTILECALTERENVPELPQHKRGPGTGTRHLLTIILIRENSASKTSVNFCRSETLKATDKISSTAVYEAKKKENVSGNRFV